MECRVHVNREAFKYWALQYMQSVKVLSPASLVFDVREAIRDGLSQICIRRRAVSITALYYEKGAIEKSIAPFMRFLENMQFFLLLYNLLILDVVVIYRKC